MWSFLIPARGRTHSALIHAKKRTSANVDRDPLVAHPMLRSEASTVMRRMMSG
jgi:hypothetical protein